MIAKPSKIRPLFMQCSIYFFILHLLLQFSTVLKSRVPENYPVMLLRRIFWKHKRHAILSWFALSINFQRPLIKMSVKDSTQRLKQ